MSRIVWDKTGERFYETGVDRAVLYPISPTGRAASPLKRQRPPISTPMFHRRR